MIKQNFLIVCEAAIIDKDTNNLYLLGIFEKIFAYVIPAIQPQFTVVTKFEDGTGIHNHQIVISHNKRGEIAKLDGKLDFSIATSSQYIGKFIGFPFPEFGEYTVEVYLDGILQPLKARLTVEQKNR